MNRTARQGRQCPFGVALCGAVFLFSLTYVGLPAPARAEGLTEAARALLEKEESIADGLDRVDRRINEVVQAKEMIRLERAVRARELTTLETRLTQLEADAAQLSLRLRGRLQMRRRSGLGESAWWRLVLSADDPTTLVRRRGSLRAVLRADLELVRAAKSSLDTVNRLQRDRAAAVAELSVSEARLNGQRERLEEERGLKSEVLRRLRAEHRLHRRVVQQQAAQRAALAIPTDTTTDTQAFAAEKGHLPMPTTGRIVRGFGRFEDPELGTETQSMGLLIDSPLGAPARAVFDGKVVYSGWYKGYGNLVIVDHGGGHHTLYGHLLAISRAQGDSVKQGEIVGEVGDTGSLRGPQLYFELRAGRRPVDPGPWLRAKP